MRGEVILVVDPDNWPTALGAIGFFGLCAGFTTRLLVLRRRAELAGASAFPVRLGARRCWVFGVFA
jgi:hypothetical protein